MWSVEELGRVVKRAWWVYDSQECMKRKLQRVLR